ncbi:MAG TPA: tetratricopeptide repeat protein [Sphingomonas sp.]|nr:tetratricopeptide repeat protein [Sphingomonas sp.]
MAVPPQTNEAFLREVDEELRRDELARLWTRWGRAFVAAIALGLLALAAFLWWRDYRAKEAGLEGEKLTTVVEQLSQSQVDRATPAIKELAHSPRPGYRATAQLAQGAVASQRGDDRLAVTAFAAVAADKKVGQPFRELALIRQTTIEFDKLPPDQVIARMQPLAKKGSPWFGSAGELLAAAQLKSGRAKDAGATFAALAADPATPASLRSRAAQMASVLGADINPAALSRLAR